MYHIKSSKKEVNIQFKNMALDLTDWNERIQPKKLASKIKQEKIDNQKLTGKNAKEKGACREKSLGHVKSFDGIEKVWK